MDLLPSEAGTPIERAQLSPGRRLAPVIARWQVVPLDRARRGLDERLLLAIPSLRRLVLGLARRRPPGSRIRRLVFTRLIRVAFGQANRGDYDAAAAPMAEDLELQMYPDAPAERPADMSPVYTGGTGYVESLRTWQSGFETFRWEPREIIDPGGSRLATRADMVGRGSGSGAETRWSQYTVLQIGDRNEIRRMSVVSAEDAMLRLLEGRSP